MCVYEWLKENLALTSSLWYLSPLYFHFAATEVLLWNLEKTLHRIIYFTSEILVTAVAQWLRCCATIRKVAGSIQPGVSGFFIYIKSFRSHYGPGVDSASNRNEYQEYFLEVKAAGA